MTTTVIDRSGQNNHGYFNGGATSSAKVIGKLGQALTFDGNNDYTDNGDFFYSDVLTVCAWLNPAVVSGSRNIVTKRNTSGTTDGTDEWTLDIYSGGVEFVSWDSGGSLLVLDTVAVPAAGTWTHACAVQGGNGNSRSLYLNGAEDINSAQNATMVDSAGRIQVGVRTNNNSTFFNGVIDDVRIYNRALSAAEVKQLYQLGTVIIRQ